MENWTHFGIVSGKNWVNFFLKKFLYKKIYSLLPESSSRFKLSNKRCSPSDVILLCQKRNVVDGN